MKIDSERIPSSVVRRTLRIKRNLDRAINEEKRVDNLILHGKTSEKRIGRYRALRKEIEILIDNLYTPIILYLLGKDYKAIYWGPGKHPFEYPPLFRTQSPTFAKFGEWTLVDKVDLREYPKEDYRCFHNYSIVRFNIIKIPNFPPQIKQGSYDLSFYNRDWTMEGAIDRASDLTLKNGGVLMTGNAMLKVPTEEVRKNYSLIFDPQLDLQWYHALFLKEK